MNRGVINYGGWLGYQNLGDVALYVAVQKIFNRYEFVPFPFVPFELSNCARVPYCSGINFFGGGTTIPNWFAWVKPNRYNYVFGAGVNHPAFWGNFDRVIIDRFKSFNFRFLGVRGNISRGLLKDWGIHSEVVGDPCLSLEANPHVKREDMKIAINIGSDGLLWGHDEQLVLREMIKFCKVLKNDGYHLILIPFCKNDIKYIRKISESENVDIFNNWFNVQSVLDLIASCKILIGERLHSLVFSASTYTPFIGLEYQPKCFDFSDSLGFSKYSVRTDKITAKRIKGMFGDLVNNWSEMHSKLVKNVKMYREKQRAFAARVIADIESLPDDKWLAPSLVEKTKHRIFWYPDFFLHKNFVNVWHFYNRLIFLRIIHHLT